jgi:hypothetical protein
LQIAHKRNYSPSVSQVSFFCPLEVVSVALGCDRSTLWRHLKPLVEHKLLDYRPHKTTLNGKTVNDGTVWCLRLHPSKGQRPRLGHHDLKHQYRNLQADILQGRTAYALSQTRKSQLNQTTNSITTSPMQQSLELNKNKENINLVLIWSLTPLTYSNPVMSDCCTGPAASLESVLDLPSASKADRNQMVAAAAAAIGHVLGDNNSHNFFCYLLWNLLRNYDLGQDYFYPVYLMIQRARADYQEGFARSAGALFVSRLKDWEVWEHLKRTPPYRVGSVPLVA